MEQRRTRRFTLQLPLSITRSGAERVTVPGRTKNISSTGVLFTTESGHDLTGGSIEYIITLNTEAHQTVHLRCVGKVVRCEQDMAAFTETPPGFRVAATLERYEFVRER
jgi:hypothetical protein